MIVTLTPEEAEVAQNALGQLKDLCESMPPLDDNGDPLQFYALPECRGVELDFTDCPGWTVAEVLGFTEEKGRLHEALPGHAAEIRSLREKIIEAAIQYLHEIPSL
jgi:hypothetical protein